MLHASTFTSMVDDRLYCYFIVVSVQVRDHHKYSCLFLKINEAQFYTSKQIKSAFGHTCISPIFECAVGTLIWEYAYVDNFKAENELVAWKQSSNLSLSFVPNIYCWLGTTRCSVVHVRLSQCHWWIWPRLFFFLLHPQQHTTQAINLLWMSRSVLQSPPLHSRCSCTGINLLRLTRKKNSNNSYC